MYFFPDACFYEFIPEKEMERSLADPSYEPRTCLMNEVEEGEKYELVISVLKGGVFMRYRVGDVYRCIALENERDQVRFPRFEYIDRIPTVIDIAGFTRITENSIGRVIGLSGLKVKDWAAAKEITENKRPFLHMYVEMEPECLFSSAVTVNILKEHMGVYFKYVDEDYKDLKKILGIDPLEITILRCGTFDTYYRGGKEKMRRINPTQYEIGELLKSQELVSAFGRRPERSV